MRLAALALALALLPAAALADGAVPVTLPTLPVVDDPASYDSLLSDLVIANVISSNCPGYEITNGEWGMLTGTADMVAAAMGLSTEVYDSNYYGPAFDVLDDPNACALYGPTVRPMLDLIASWGGRPTVK